MRLITALTILACVGLVMSWDFDIFKGKKETKEAKEQWTIKKMASQFAEYFIKDKENSKEAVDAIKQGSWWDRIKAGAGIAIDTTSKRKEEEKKSESWFDSFKIWKRKDQNAEEEDSETSSSDFSFKNWADTFKFWDNKKVKHELHSGADELKDQVGITSKKIQKAIGRKSKGLDKIMDKAENLKLPMIDFPQVIKDIKTEDIKLQECIKYLKPALPGLMKFGKEASKQHTNRAVGSLFDVLKSLPDISTNCVGKEFKLSDNKADNKKCVKDIVVLTELVSNLAKHPLQVVSEVKRMKELVSMVPQCLAHCTTAFEEED